MLSTFEAKYQATKFKEKMQRKVAWLLPRSIVMWAYIRVVLHATNGKWGNTVVPDITAMDALKRWDESNAGAVIPSNAYSHTNSKGVTYYLHKKAVTLRGGKQQMIYFFRKNVGDIDSSTNAPYEATELPPNFKVNENPRNGFLTVVRTTDPQGEEPN